jgi:hypothetical protein
MRQPSTIAVVLALVLSATFAVRAGEIYCDSQGRNCSDRPGPNSVPVHVANPPPSALSAAASAPGNAPKPPIDANANAELKDAATRAAVDKDVASKRAEDCKQAKDKYQQSITAHRIYKLGKDGERIYLTDAELDQARLNARTQMDRSCGTSGN